MRVCVWREATGDADALIAQADAIMYEEKKGILCAGKMRKHPCFESSEQGCFLLTI